MRDLSLPQKAKVLSTLNEPTTPVDTSEVQVLKSRVEFLRSVLRSLLIRSPTERKDDVQSILKDLDRISSPVQLQAAVDSRFNPNYFRNEPDVDFKVALANSLYTYMRLRVPSYTNPTMKAIGEQSLEVSDLLKNFIED